MPSPYGSIVGCGTTACGAVAVAHIRHRLPTNTFPGSPYCTTFVWLCGVFAIMETGVIHRRREVANRVLPLKSSLAFLQGMQCNTYEYSRSCLQPQRTQCQQHEALTAGTAADAFLYPHHRAQTAASCCVCLAFAANPANGSMCRASSCEPHATNPTPTTTSIARAA